MIKGATFCSHYVSGFNKVQLNNICWLCFSFEIFVVLECINIIFIAGFLCFKCFRNSGILVEGAVLCILLKVTQRFALLLRGGALCNFRRLHLCNFHEQGCGFYIMENLCNSRGGGLSWHRTRFQKWPNIKCSGGESLKVPGGCRFIKSSIWRTYYFQILKLPLGVLNHRRDQTYESEVRVFLLQPRANTKKAAGADVLIFRHAEL